MLVGGEKLLGFISLYAVERIFIVCGNNENNVAKLIICFSNFAAYSGNGLGLASIRGEHKLIIVVCEEEIAVFQHLNVLAKFICYFCALLAVGEIKGEIKKIDKSSEYIRLSTGGSIAASVDDDEILISSKGGDFETFFEADESIERMFLTPNFKSAYYYSDDSLYFPLCSRENIHRLRQ